MRRKQVSVWWKRMLLQWDNHVQTLLSNRRSCAEKVVVRNVERLLHLMHSHLRSSSRMSRSLVASFSLYLAAWIGSMPHSEKNRVTLGSCPIGTCCICWSRLLAALSSFVWMVASRILVFIQAFTDWMVAPFGPSRSKYNVDPWHLRLLSCSIAEGGVLPKRSVCWTVLFGGVGVKVLGSTRGALCVKGKCKGGGMSRSVRRTGVVMPLSSMDGSAGWETSGCAEGYIVGSAWLVRRSAFSCSKCLIRLLTSEDGVCWTNETMCRPTFSTNLELACLRFSHTVRSLGMFSLMAISCNNWLKSMRLSLRKRCSEQEKNASCRDLNISR